MVIEKLPPRGVALPTEVKLPARVMATRPALGPELEVTEPTASPGLSDATVWGLHPCPLPPAVPAQVFRPEVQSATTDVCRAGALHHYLV